MIEVFGCEIQCGKCLDLSVLEWQAALHLLNGVQPQPSDLSPVGAQERRWKCLAEVVHGPVSVAAQSPAGFALSLRILLWIQGTGVLCKPPEVPSGACRGLWSFTRLQKGISCSLLSISCIQNPKAEHVSVQPLALSMFTFQPCKCLCLVSLLRQFGLLVAHLGASAGKGDHSFWSFCLLSARRELPVAVLESG